MLWDYFLRCHIEFSFGLTPNLQTTTLEKLGAGATVRGSGTLAALAEGLRPLPA